MLRRRQPVSRPTDSGCKGGHLVVSPLDPDWRADGVAPATGVAMPQENHAVATAPASGASYAPPAAPAPMPAAPVAPMPPAPVAAMPAAPVAPMPAAPVAEPAPALPEQPAPASADASSTGRAALEENSELEAGLLTDLLIEVLDKGASDLHITAGARPTIRLNGTLMQLEERPIMTPPTIQRMLYAVLTQKQREKFEEVLELDFAYAVPGKARFRVNIYRQRDALGAAFRLIPYEIKPLEALGIPPSISNFAMLPRGFVLVTGPTGSGKSTTLASLVDLANRNRRDHIMTVEDPIEFLHRHKSCLVNQR